MFTDSVSSLSVALDELCRLLARVSREDLTKETPCIGWDIENLLAHLAGQHHGVIASLCGGGRELEAWAAMASPSLDDLIASTIEIRRLASAAGATSGTTPEAMAWMPEVRAAGPIPVGVLISAFLLDTVVHSWDLAAALGERLEVPDDLLRLVAEAALRIPDDEARTRPGAAFAPSLPDADRPDGDPLRTLLARTGRRLTWRARSEH